MKMKMKMKKVKKMKNSADNWSLDPVFEDLLRAWHSLTPEEHEALDKWVNTVQLSKRTLKSKNA